MWYGFKIDAEDNYQTLAYTFVVLTTVKAAGCKPLSSTILLVPITAWAQVL